MGFGCEDCSGEVVLDESTGGYVCIDCGLIISRKDINREPEWRFYEEEMSKVRTGPPPNLLTPDRGITTTIGWAEGDSSGWTKKDLGRLRVLQSRLRTAEYMRNNLSKALNKMNQIAKRLKISRTVLERASYIYRMALRKGLIKGREINSIVTAALFIAIRQNEIPCTFKDLGEAAGIDRREIARRYKLLIRALELRVPVLDPSIFLGRFCSQVHLDKRVKVEARHIVRLAQKEKLTAGKDPRGTAAAAIYYACFLLDVQKNQQDIANAADTTEVTLRNRFNDLKEGLKLENPLSVDKAGETGSGRTEMGVVEKVAAYWQRSPRK